jgi:hypothetical protein
MSTELYDALGRLERERNLWRALAIVLAAAFALLLAVGGVLAFSLHRQAEMQRLMAVEAEHVARQQAGMALEQAQKAVEQMKANVPEMALEQAQEAVEQMKANVP